MNGTIENFIPACLDEWALLTALAILYVADSMQLCAALHRCMRRCNNHYDIICMETK